MKSAMMGFDETCLVGLYDKLLERKDLSDELHMRLMQNKERILKIYGKIQGKWWKTGSFWQKLYRLENRYGKASYELKQEIKAFDIVGDDLNLVILELEKNEEIKEE